MTIIRTAIILLIILLPLTAWAEMSQFSPQGQGNIPLPDGAPTRIAVDYTGRTYVTSPLSKEVLVYSHNGKLLMRLKGFQRPLSVAADRMNRIYIGDEALGVVGVYNNKGELLYYLDAGEGKFGIPNDIAISTRYGTHYGTRYGIYITDSKANKVMVYSTEGVFQFSFGSEMLNFPTGIVIDDSIGEVFVSDHNNKRIVVFTMDGNFLREIDAGGSWFGGGDFLRPQGIALDSGRLYIVDSYNSTLAVYERAKNGSTEKFLGYLGNYGSGDGEFRIPMDAAFDKLGRLLVTNTNNQRIEILGIEKLPCKSDHWRCKKGGK
ncbi:MAG: NHL repeat-containing protein [Nitrospirae bacterium]|nr:NHL repeat-containing protein [Nitrospirota bacterium]